MLLGIFWYNYPDQVIGSVYTGKRGVSATVSFENTSLWAPGMSDLALVGGLTNLQA